MPTRNYWIGVVSQDHVAIGVAGGFIQVNHGKSGPLERMQPGDGFVFYSPRQAYPDGAAVQAFTAMGRVAAGAVISTPVADGAAFFRRAVDFLPAQAAPVKPLLESLTFIRNKQHWGAAFRFGFVRVGAADFARIAAAMNCAFAVDVVPAAAT
ncbi:MAG: EVE domain-containing protein [Betaproteobacteria bacterium]